MASGHVKQGSTVYREGIGMVNEVEMGSNRVIGIPHVLHTDIQPSLLLKPAVDTTNLFVFVSVVFNEACNAYDEDGEWECY